jgi:hypothetical protein
MALTETQQLALDALFAQIDAHKPAQAEQPALPAKTTSVGGMLAQALSLITGVSENAAAGRINAIGASKDAIELSFVDWAEKRPLDAALTFLGGAALAFYQAEKDVNPKIATYTDAFYYISTCASVGYADIFAMTQSGKAVASFVMIVGPALAAKALDRPK